MLPDSLPGNGVWSAARGEGRGAFFWDPGGDAVAPVVEVPALVPGGSRGGSAPAPDFVVLGVYEEAGPAGAACVGGQGGRFQSG
eukprot:10969884-Heterocapsa_arctica.AAC.1